MKTWDEVIDCKKKSKKSAKGSKKKKESTMPSFRRLSRCLSFNLPPPISTTFTIVSESCGPYRSQCVDLRNNLK